MTELGEIPNNWEVKKLDEISNITRLAGAEYSDIWETDDNGTIIALKGNNIGKNNLILNDIERITEEMSNRLIRSKLFKNDIDFPCVGTIGKATVINEDNKYHINQNIAKITPSSGINSLYLSYYLMSDFTVKEIFKYNTSSSQPNVLVGNLRKFNIIVPSTEEQEKIASILSIVDEQIDNVDALIEKNKELKKGLMQTLLTKGIGHTKFKKTEIGEIPDEWEVINAGRVFDIITDYVANGSFASLAANVEYKESEDFAIVVRLTDYKNEYKGPFVYVDKKAYDFLSKSKLEDNDIIIANVGAYAGYVFRAPNINKPITLGPNAILVRSEQNREFIYYWLSSEFGQKAIKEIISTTAQPKFNKTDFKKILLPIPNLKEQYKISSILLKTDERIEEHEKEKKKLEQLKKGLMQQLLTGRIRVV